jgi:rhamnosyltransferase
MLPKFSLVIPVRNGGDIFAKSIRSILTQNLQPEEIIIYDTESTDGCVTQALSQIRDIPCHVVPVRKAEFDHGGTRNLALKKAKFPWVLFMTQDAICSDNKAFEGLLAATREKNVAAAYGRQIPHAGASALAATARNINYGNRAITQDMNSAPQMGIKTWFTSNSFCIWDRKALLKLGGFGEKLILGEDMHAAARLIQSGLTIRYEPSGVVHHSHNYSALEEFRRYFDIGVFHTKHADLLFRAGNASSEGLQFVIKQLGQLWQAKAFIALLRFPFHIAAKFLGYKMGRKYTLFGNRWARALSMHKSYWPSASD